MSHRFRGMTFVALAAALLLPAVLLGQDGRSRRDRDRDWNWDRRDSAHIRVGQDYTLSEGSVLTGALLVIGGAVTLNGTVEDDVTAIGGRIDVGPTAVIRGDLHSVGGRVSIDPAAQVSGQVDEVTTDWGRVFGGLPSELGVVNDRFWAWAAVWLTILRLSLTFVAGALIALMAPSALRNVGQRVASTPGWAFITGGATQILLTPALVALCIALVITIIGIPLLALVPLLLGALAIVWVVGFTAVAAGLGAALRRRSLPADAGSHYTGGRVLDFVLGFFVLTGVTIVWQVFAVGSSWMAVIAVPLGAAGLAIEYVAWTLGLGAALLTLFDARRSIGVIPPPLPPRVGDVSTAPGF